MSLLAFRDLHDHNGLFQQENWKDGYVKMTVPTSLPKLKDRLQDFYDRQHSNNCRFVVQA